MTASLELQPIGVLDMPQAAVDFLGGKLTGSGMGYNCLFAVNDDTFVSYLGEFPYMQTSGELDHFIEIVDYNRDGVEVGYAQACYNENPAGPATWYSDALTDKPFIRWTYTEKEYAGKHRLGRRRLTALNLATRALFDLPLHSSWNVSTSARRAWESLERDGSVTRYPQWVGNDHVESGGYFVDRFHFIEN